MAGLLASAGGCATVNVPNVGSSDYHVEDDEQRIFKRSEEVTEAIDAGGISYPDVNLEAYVNEIAAKLAPPDLNLDSKIKIRIHVLRDPTLNAFAFANGTIYVHSGIIAAADNEAQLASIIGHEMTHVYHRHTLKQFRSAKNSAAFWSTFGLPIDFVAGGLGSLLAQFSFLSSVSGFSQHLEFEADEGGFAMMKREGYNTEESVKLFEELARFTKDEDFKEPFFFSSHPRVLERVEKFKELNAADPQASKAGTTNDEKFQSLTRQLKLDTIDLCFERGFYKTAEHNIDRYLALYNDDVRGWYRKAELFRRRQDPLPKAKVREKADDYKQALELYEKTLALDANFASAWAGQARVYQKIAKIDQAKASFKKYLELEPSSRERAYIEQFINSSTETSK